MKEKGIKILFSIFLLASVLMPFSVSADTISSANIIGVNKVLIESNYIESVTRTNTRYDRFTFTYEYEVLLDDYYIGYINGSIQQSYRDYDVSLSTPTTENRSLTKPNMSYYVNGNSFKTSLSITAWCYVISGSSQVDPTNIYNPVFSLNTSNVTKYQDIDSLDTVINILNDIKDVVYIDVLSELQTIVSNTSLSNTYLNIISKARQWNIPFESFTANEYVLSRVDNVTGYSLYDFLNYNYYQFPVYLIKANNSVCDVVMSSSGNRSKIRFILGIRRNPISTSNVYQYLGLDSTKINVSQILTLDTTYNYNTGYGTNIVFYDMIFENISGATTFLNIKFDIDTIYVPIRYNYLYKFNDVSTDFALIWGLSNQLLDDLHIIVQGTQQSQQAGSDLDDATSDMQSDFNSYYSIENSANSDFNSALNGINFNDQIAGNQSFLDSASFVKTVFSSMMQIPILSTFVIILCIILMARIFL